MQILLPCRKKFDNLVISKGFYGDTVVLQLNPPLIQNEGRMIDDTVSVKLKHYIKGVVMHYTLDGSGPDSISSPVYDGSLLLRNHGTVKVKAFKKGWISSETVETYFFKGSYKADSAFCVIAPDPAFKGKGGKTLVDLEKGDNIFGSGKWLGFKSNMEVMLLFNEAVEVSSVTVSSLVDIGSYIMPAKMIKVYGGRDKNNLHLLATVSPEQPGKPAPVFQRGIDVNFENNHYVL
jgi:hypothetical protein